MSDEFPKFMNSYEIASILRQLYVEKEEIEFIHFYYDNQEEAVQQLKEHAQCWWDRARGLEDFTAPEVGIFLKFANKYREIKRGDRGKKLIEAEAREKMLEYRYGEFIDKKYWDDLMFIVEYLETGRANTLMQAIELFEEDNGDEDGEI